MQKSSSTVRSPEVDFYIPAARSVIQGGGHWVHTLISAGAKVLPTGCNPHIARATVVGLRIIYNVWRDTKCHRTEGGSLRDLNNNLTPCVAGQNLIIRTEHVVEIVNRIDDRLNIAYTKVFPVYRESLCSRLVWLTVRDHLRDGIQQPRGFRLVDHEPPAKGLP